MTPSATPRSPLALAALIATMSCTVTTSSTRSGPAPAAPPAGWTRQCFPQPGSRCSNSNCRSTLNGPGGNIYVDTRAKEYARHEVPGWNQSRGARVGNAIAGAYLRGLGATTENVRIGHGTRLVSEAATGGWQLSCDVTWLLTEDVKQSSRNDMEQVVGAVLNSQGMECRAAPLVDSTMASWRFTRGVAPKFESLAKMLDSLSAVNSELLMASPPMTLVRLGADGSVIARYEAVLESTTRMRISREDRKLVARLHWGSGTTVDVAGDATEDEKHIARLIAGAMTVPLKTRV